VGRVIPVAEERPFLGLYATTTNCHYHQLPLLAGPGALGTQIQSAPSQYSLNRVLFIFEHTQMPRSNRPFVRLHVTPYRPGGVCSQG
jgi:hypothetical protein